MKPPQDKGLGPPVKPFDETFSAETVIMEELERFYPHGDIDRLDQRLGEAIGAEKWERLKRRSWRDSRGRMCPNCSHNRVCVLIPVAMLVMAILMFI